ncbi:MAG: cytochrome c family protein [Alphaproteobacteria bacterium]|nr:cytochrome c family protein [Alphaproteobacteria bacterium]
MGLIAVGALVLGAADARAGDVEKGKQAYGKCKACHALEDGKTGIGPSLHGIFGRKAGSVPKFAYSKDMAALGLAWDDDSLRNYLRNPKQMVPNTKMVFAGITRDAELDDLLAYLKVATKPQ